MNSPENSQKPTQPTADETAGHHDPVILNAVKNALAEDIGDGDVTADLVPADEQAHARVIAREPATLCGQAWFNCCFSEVDSHIQIDWAVEDGDLVYPDQVLCRLTGPARALLTAERCALNFLQTLSGTATSTRLYVNKIKGTRARILDTRKTIPGLRRAQKYAVFCGGGVNHRHGLYDGILIKENHIHAAGNIAAAVAKGRERHAGIPLGVEVENIGEVEQALQASADYILLDNFETHLLARAVNMAERHKRFSTDKIELEASGNITLDNIREIADTGVDRISIGGLTKHVRAIDLSMRFFDADAPDEGLVS